MAYCKKCKVNMAPLAMELFKKDNIQLCRVCRGIAAPLGANKNEWTK